MYVISIFFVNSVLSVSITALTSKESFALLILEYPEFIFYQYMYMSEQTPDCAYKWMPK